MTFTIRSKYVHIVDGDVRVTRYADGSLALVADDGSGEPPERLSVNLAGYGMTPPAGHVYVKDYSEHEGLPHALEEAGVAFKEEEVRFGPWGHGWLMRVSERVLSNE